MRTNFVVLWLEKQHVCWNLWICLTSCRQIWFHPYSKGCLKNAPCATEIHILNVWQAALISSVWLLLYEIRLHQKYFLSFLLFFVARVDLSKSKENLDNELFSKMLVGRAIHTCDWNATLFSPLLFFKYEKRNCIRFRNHKFSFCMYGVRRFNWMYRYFVQCCTKTIYVYWPLLHIAAAAAVAAPTTTRTISFDLSWNETANFTSVSHSYAMECFPHISHTVDISFA